MQVLKKPDARYAVSTGVPDVSGCGAHSRRSFHAGRPCCVQHVQFARPDAAAAAVGALDNQHVSSLILSGGDAVVAALGFCARHPRGPA